MISAIKIDNNIFINMHMEQVYTEVTERNLECNRRVGIPEGSFEYMKCDHVTRETLVRLKVFLEKNKGSIVILDFQNEKLRAVQNNMGIFLNELITTEVYVINVSEELFKQSNLKEKVFGEDINNFYKAFNEKKLDYIMEISEEKEYENQSGAILSKYINVKKIIENNSQFFMWSYMLCNNLMENGIFDTINDNKSTRPTLLAHTLNGVCIATMISKLLNLKMIYIDHLGPHNRITGITFPENFEAYQNYLVVVDFICLGNELLRAKNIVEFIGGEYKGFIGMIKLDISAVSTSQNGDELIKEVVVCISPQEAAEKLGYKIETKLTKGK